jgi:bifunctional DNA-binding transcriptional regulator/antitoxin component of YhaV-PrlF toxin-antitoxin module
MLILMSEGFYIWITMTDDIRGKKALRPHGAIRVLDDRGFSYLPRLLRQELDAKKGTSLPFFLDANTALIVRRDCSLSDVLKSLDILKQDLQLRWKEEEEIDDR